MGRKKLNKEYCLAITINGEEYYYASKGSTRVRVNDGWSNWKYVDVIRLTKNGKSAKKLKTEKYLQTHFNDILYSKDYQFKFGRKLLGTSDDLMTQKISNLEENIIENRAIWKNSLSELKKVKIFKTDKVKIFETDYKEIREKITNLNTALSQMYSDNKSLKFLKKRQTNKNDITMSILDASHNFRYSKLKKLMQDNE